MRTNTRSIFVRSERAENAMILAVMPNTPNVAPAPRVLTATISEISVGQNFRIRLVARVAQKTR